MGISAIIFYQENNEITGFLLTKIYYCKNLTRVITIPDGMAYIDGGEFKRNSISPKKEIQHISSLEASLWIRLKLPKNIKVMGKYASDYADAWMSQKCILV